MIKIQIKKNLITITGHANYDDYGKDIVCASVSSIVITSINAALKVDNTSVIYKEKTDKLTIEVVKNNEYVNIIIQNMIDMLNELALTYKKNIKIIKEETP